MTPVWWLLALIPALVALYFLKLKRQDAPVSSTLLWKRSLEDLHVNSPFQRLRRSLLLLLQLVTLSLLIAAVWQPRCDRVRSGGRNLLVLIDRSASMSAVEGDATRLEIAKRRALALVRELGVEDRMAVRTFDSALRTVQPLTGDQEALEVRIRGIGPSALPTDLASALEATYAIAETLPTAEVWVIGDGCYGDLTGAPLEAERLDLRFVSVATGLDNVAITEADVRRGFGRDRRTEAFALLENRAATSRSLTVGVHREDVLLRAQSIEVPAEGSVPVIFDVTGTEPGVLRIEVESDDGLDLDDRAWVELPAPTEIEVVLITRGNFVLERVLAAIPNVRLRVVASEAEIADDIDTEDGTTRRVVVRDRVELGSVPRHPTILVACDAPLPEGAAAAKEVDAPLVIDSDVTHPVNYMASFSDLVIRRSRVYEGGADVRPLVDSEEGAVIAEAVYRPAGGYPVRALLIGFDIYESNWPINNHSFPIFFVNAINWLGEGGADRPARWRTGEALSHRIAARDGVEELGDLRFRSPSGATLAAVVETGGEVVLGTVEEAGIYRLLASDEELRAFPVSVLSASEADLRPAPTIELGDVRIRAEESVHDDRHDLWMWFALGGLGILLLEWYVYNRRVYV